MYTAETSCMGGVEEGVWLNSVANWLVCFHALLTAC
jgi:hypothetical protein